jgi:hypothetical protein
MPYQKHFYHSVIEIDSLFVELDDLHLTESEKHHLGELIDTNLHHEVLDVIFAQLGDDDKKVFLNHLSRGDDSKIWELLNDKAENIEDKIKAAAETVKKELHEDIKEAKMLKEKK